MVEIYLDAILLDMPKENELLKDLKRLEEKLIEIDGYSPGSHFIDTEVKTKYLVSDQVSLVFEKREELFNQKSLIENQIRNLCILKRIVQRIFPQALAKKFIGYYITGEIFFLNNDEIEFMFQLLDIDSFFRVILKLELFKEECDIT